MTQPWKLGQSRIWDAQGPLPEKPQLTRLLDAGVGCVETGVRWGWESERYEAHTQRLADIIGAFQSGGVTVWSVHLPGGRYIDLSHPEYAAAGIDLLAAYMEVCAGLGVGRVVVHPSFEPIAPQERQARMEVCRDSLRQLARGDIAIAVENLPRTCLCNTAQEMDALLAPLEGIARACVDVNHCQARGDTIPLLLKMGGRLETIHISDDDGEDERHWFPGEGILNWPGILTALEDIGYAGAFIYELSGKEDPFAIRANYDKLMDAWWQGLGSNP